MKPLKSLIPLVPLGVQGAENCAFPFQKLRSKGRAGPYGRTVVGWGRKKSSPFTLRLPVALSVTVRLRVLCHLLLRLADFCGAPQRALAKTGALHRSQLPVSAAGSGRCSRPHRGRQEHARGCRPGGGKANLLTASPYTPFALIDGGTLGSHFGGAGETPAGRRD